MPSDDVPPPSPSSFADPRRLHPASIALGIPLTQLIQALIFPAAAAVTTGGRITLWLLVGVAAAGLVVRTLAWQRFRYSFDGRVIRVSSGVISRNHRSVDIGRIQQVELDRSLAHRMVGVTTVRIETAGSNSGPEIELRVLTHMQALALRAAVRTSQRLTAGSNG
ncbi:MAG: PH domain-containing protein, partial [Nitriliruptoraceae bacterium]